MQGDLRWDRRARFAHRCQVAWVGLLAEGRNFEAVVWGQVVDAIFCNEPEIAILRARFHRLPEGTIAAIREAFQLTPPPDRL